MYIDIDACGCSNTCRHCSPNGHAPGGEFYSLSELRAIKQQWGPLTIRFEPTIHPQFPEIYAPDIAGEHGGWLVTNGCGLAHRDDADQVMQKMQWMGFHTLAFTLHGSVQHHDWFTRRPGAFDAILQATRRARKANFIIHWQIFVDRKGIGDTEKLVDLALSECGELPSLSVPYHRVGGRLWQYEVMRPTLGDIERFRLPELIDDPKKNIFAKANLLTNRAWLEKWRQKPDSSEFKHPYEPRTWSDLTDYEFLSLRISRMRKVYLDPMCSPIIYLGNLSDGKKSLLGRLASLPKPAHIDLQPQEVELTPDEEEHLHPSGFSLRYKEISKRWLTTCV